MTFWKNSTLDPLRKYRFRVTIEKSIWWAKSVTQPSPEVSVSEHQLINHMVKFPGIVTWNDIDVNIIDVGGKGIEFFSKLKGYGYNLGQATDIIDGMQKKQYDDLQVLIEKIDADGKTLEIWSLYNVFIKSIKYGDLDYDSDDLLDIALTLSYDSAHLAKTSKTLNEASVAGSVESAVQE